MKPTVRVLLLVVLLVSLLARLAHAQGSGPNTGGPAPQNYVPLDGIASLLLASGVGYGLRQLRKRPRPC